MIQHGSDVIVTQRMFQDFSNQVRYWDKYVDACKRAGTALGTFVAPSTGEFVSGQVLLIVILLILVFNITSLGCTQGFHRGGQIHPRLPCWMTSSPFTFGCPTRTSYVVLSIFICYRTFRTSLGPKDPQPKWRVASFFSGALGLELGFRSSDSQAF